MLQALVVVTLPVTLYFVLKTGSRGSLLVIAAMVTVCFFVLPLQKKFTAAA